MTKHAIEAAAEAVRFGVQLGFHDEVVNPNEVARAAILAYLSALAGDEESVEACGDAALSEMPLQVKYWQENGRIHATPITQGHPEFVDPRNAVRAVLAVLLSRAKEQKP